MNAAQTSAVDCPPPEVFNIIGEKWTFLILCNAMFGTVHFEDFQADLGIARNILSNRLAKLVRHGILTRQVLESDKRRVVYRLTEKGWALVPMMTALNQWVNCWERTEPFPTSLVDRRDRLPVQQMALYAQDGRQLALTDVIWLDKEGREVFSLYRRPDTTEDATAH